MQKKLIDLVSAMGPRWIPVASDIRSFGIVLVVFGCGFFGWGTYTTFEALQSLKWPTVEGRIVDVDASEPKRISGDVKDSNINQRIKYMYLVGSKTFFGNRIYFGQNLSDYRLLAQYSKGMPVSVSYHPARPEISLLEPGLKFKNFIIFDAAAILLLLGLGIAWVGHKMILAKE